jgi:hypothetical protein
LENIIKIDMENIMNSIELLENVLLDKFSSEYMTFIHDFNTVERLSFYKKYKNIIEEEFSEDDIIEPDFERKYLFSAFAIKNKLVFKIDWSGEEYNGQVKKCINRLLKNYGIENFKWKNKNIFKEIMQQDIKRGEYLPLLFKKLNDELETIDYKIGFIDMCSDEHYYFIISISDYEKISINRDIIYDTKLYEMYLIPTNDMSVKLKINIKNKFNLKLDEIKEFMNQNKILMGTGDEIEMKIEKNKIEELGGKIIIEEKI